MIKVFIVEDHSVVVEGLLVMIQNQPTIRVVGTASNATDCLTFLLNNTADVILMDINLPDMNGVELCKEVKTKYSSVMVLGLSTFNQGLYMSKIMESGASGYLLKNVSTQELTEAITTVAGGGVYFSFEAGKTYKATLEKNSSTPVLTKREKEILKLITEGFTNLQMAQQLFISIDTVDTHRKNLYTKLNVKNTALLIRYAIDHSFI